MTKDRFAQRQKICGNENCDMRGWGFVIEGVSIERRETLKMAKNGQKTHKIIKKFRVRLRISKKSSNFALTFEAEE